MATPSEVAAGLREIADAIRTQRMVIEKAQLNVIGAGEQLDQLPITYADVVATVNAYAVDSTDYFERTSKDSLAKMTTEFTALKVDADAIVAVAL